MKTLFGLFLFMALFSFCLGQEYQIDRDPSIFISASKILIKGTRTDIAIGANFNNYFYYSFYVSKIPGLRLECRIHKGWVTGFSLMDDAGKYFLRYHFGLKFSRHFMVSESFRPDREGGIELVYFF